ncbi:MAG: Decaprenyl diphosphate synthase-like protein [Benjaminiella poitrasii]|nr:MAG: Decaprenyl diphosphate synthase-like protein [Benjaminiella poitrasii]
MNLRTKAVYENYDIKHAIKERRTRKLGSIKRQLSNNSFSQRLYKSLLYALQFVYIVFIAFRSLYTYLYNLYIFKRCHDIQQRIQYDKTQLTKIPHHLTILISRELLSTRTYQDWEKIMSDISLTTCWAWEFGIKEVSVYDATGVLKSMVTDLQEQQSTAFHDWVNNGDDSNKERNRSEVKFSILSAEDGKPYVGRVAQQLARNNLNSEFDISLVNQQMHVNTISDPDLMIIYNGLPHNYISLDGYPPWHIRLTEMINCFNCHRLDYGLFSKCLYRYSKVEQRFGR